MAGKVPETYKRKRNDRMRIPRQVRVLLATVALASVALLLAGTTAMAGFTEKGSMPPAWTTMFETTTDAMTPAQEEVLILGYYEVLTEAALTDDATMFTSEATTTTHEAAPKIVAAISGGDHPTASEISTSTATTGGKDGLEYTAATTTDDTTDWPGMLDLKPFDLDEMSSSTQADQTVPGASARVDDTGVDDRAVVGVKAHSGGINSAYDDSGGSAVVKIGDEARKKKVSHIAAKTVDKKMEQAGVTPPHVQKGFTS